MPWTGRSFHDAVIRHTLVGTQFYDMPWTGRSFFITSPVRDKVLPYTLIVTPFYDMSGSERSFQDAVLRMVLVGTQFNINTRSNNELAHLLLIGGTHIHKVQNMYVYK